MRAAGNGILGDADTRGEEAGDEVIPLPGSGLGGRDHRRSIELTHRGQVRAQVPDRTFVGEQRQ